jgi:hypothetical protein
MLRLDHRTLRAAPRAFKAVSGLTIGEFDRLVERVQAGLQEERRRRPDRRRAPGAGHPYGLSVADQVLLTLAARRLRLAHEVLAYLFGVSRSTALRTVGRIAPLLRSRSEPAPARPGRSSRRLRTDGP